MHAIIINTKLESLRMFNQFKFQAFIIVLLGACSLNSCLLGLEDDDIKVGRTPSGGFCVYGEFELPNTNTYERDTDTQMRHNSRNEHNERWWDDREPSYNNYGRDDRFKSRTQIEHKRHLANKAPCGKGLCKPDFDDLEQITTSHRHVSRQVDRYSPTTQSHKGSYFLQLSRKYEGEAGVHATELEIIRDFRQGYEQVAKRYDEDDKLVDLGRQMLYKAEELLLLEKPLIEYATFLRRARDILEYLDQPKAKTPDLPELSNRAHGLIRELGNSPKHYLSDPQNIVNGGLRLEIIDCVNKIAEADFYASSYLDGDLLGILALVTAQEAYELGEEENFGEAFAVQDEANCYARFLHFLGVLERTDTAALDGAGEIIGSAVATGSKVLAKGMAKGALNAGASLGNMATTAVTNPLQAASDFAHYRFALPLFLGNVILRACTDREKLWEDGRQFADVVRDYVTNSSGEQMAEDGIAFIVEALIFAKIRGVGGKAAKAVGNKIKDTAAFIQLQKGLKSTAAKGKECAKRVFSKQTKAVLKDTEKFAQASSNCLADTQKKANKQLSKWIQESKKGKAPNLREIILPSGEKIVFRRDIGEYAHSIRSGGYPFPVDYYNIDVHMPFRGGYRVVFKYHVIVNERMDIIDDFGKSYSFDWLPLKGELSLTRGTSLIPIEER